jgi:hypothetical protein
MSLSVFVGPQRSLLRGVPFSSSEDGPATWSSWNWSGGANYIWSGTRTTLALEISRRISDGAGLQGIVQLSSVTAEVRRQLTRQWKGKLLVSENRNNALGANSTALSYVSFAGGMSRMLNQRLSLEFQYGHIHQAGSGAETTAFLADHNRVSISLAYELKGALQR